MNKRLMWLAIEIAFCAMSLHGQETRHLTLDEAIDLSVKNSKQLKGSEAKIEEATAALREAVERKLPDVKVQGAYMWLSSPNIDMQTKNTNTGNGNGNGNQ